MKKEKIIQAVIRGVYANEVLMGMASFHYPQTDQVQRKILKHAQIIYELYREQQETEESDEEFFHGKSFKQQYLFDLEDL